MSYLTIIVLCKDNPGELRRTLLSIISCSSESSFLKEIQVLVIDSSSDGLCHEMALMMADAIPLIQYEWIAARGIYRAKNHGVSIAKTEFIQFLNSGDIYADESGLHKCLEAIKQNLSNETSLIYFDSLELHHPAESLILCPTRESRDIVSESLDACAKPYWEDFPRTASCLFRSKKLSIDTMKYHIAEDHRFILSLIASDDGTCCTRGSGCLTIYEVGGYSWQSALQGAYERCCIQKDFYRGDEKDLYPLFIDFMVCNLKGFIGIQGEP